jgi:hypothetical protein
MFEEMLALLAKPARYVCVWRDGELYVELAERPARADDIRRGEKAARAIAASGDGLVA